MKRAKNKLALGLAIALTAIAAVAVCSRPSQAQGGSDVLLIKNATIITVTKGTIKNGSVLVRNGKIAEVGANVAAPSGATVIYGTGMFVA